ncbi:MAG TPA: ABC transporter substrate-binding protein [Acetobacteraceae bacterium]|nr:ABC transporter substrate-binding protein [Acetobacteraceae bacterium]
MRTGVCWIAAVMLAAAWGAAPARAQKGADTFGNVRIPVIVKATTSQYWATVFDGARAAAKALGVKIETLGATAETDVAGEVNITDNAVATHPTALVIAATNAVALADPIARATAAGIPVIMIDSAANTDKFVTFLATNNETGGQKAADEIAACIKARTGKAVGKVAYLTALAGAQSLNDRDRGFVEQIKKYPGIKVVDHRVGNNDASKALSDTEDLLTKTPDMAGIFADNELEGDGAGTAVADKSLGSKLCLVAFDTSDQEVGFLRKGIIDGLIVQNPYMMGYAGVWYALAASKGAVFPKFVDSGVHVITKGNIASPAMVGLLDPKKYKLTAFLGD